MDGSAATNRAHASSAVAAMVDFVNRSISDGSWRAGDKLPTERELEKRFGIARNTLRKGMRVLAEQGKIVRHVGRGTFVTRSTMNDAGHGAVSLEHDGRDLVRRIHGASPVEIMEIRILIEPPVIELAATRATAGDLTEMMECLGRGEAAETVAEFEQWDGKFHVKILEAARNQLDQRGKAPGRVGYPERADPYTRPPAGCAK